MRPQRRNFIGFDVSGNRGTFWKESRNRKPTPDVRGSVLTDLCSGAGFQRGRGTMRKLATALIVVLALGGIAVAQPAAKGNPPPPAGGNTKTKVYDFSGDTIEGDLIKPEGSTVDARDFAKHSSLIRIRTNFIPEIIKSAEDL